MRTVIWSGKSRKRCKLEIYREDGIQIENEHMKNVQLSYDLRGKKSNEVLLHAHLISKILNSEKPNFSKDM